MPTYEYECSSCRNAWERFQSIKADPERKCPKCGRMTARRKIGMGAAILSGGRSGDAPEPSAGAAAAATTADGAKPAAAGSPPAPADAKAAGTPAPAAAAPTAPAGDAGKLNSTHPARDGRGAGNLRDAIRRQRGEPRAAPKGDSRPAAKPAGRSPAKPSPNRSTPSRRDGRSR